MHKFKILVSSIALASFSATATAAPELYMGAQMGYQNTDLEFGYSTDFISIAQDFSLSGVAGGVFAGAKFDINNSLFIAPEVNVGTSTADGGYRESWDGGNYELEAEAGTSFGLGVLLGTQLTSDTTVYGRLGYQRTDYELTESGTFTDTTSYDETFGGIRYGVGMETTVTEQVALRLDWSQTQYSDESFDDGFGGTESYEPTESLFQAGVSFRF